ncbi:MAG: ATP-dependent DNA helicase DinG [Cellvibrionaceae bacterium]|nr:ATP-dependent DNA helicase DinG [Cellvibrionaceae bacterium]
MLDEQIKQDIQRAYRDFLNAKGLKPRYGQKLMIAEIARCLAGQNAHSEAPEAASICVVEAGTGTGKTIGYLLPSIVIARALGKKIVLSTATVALQEQVVHKDLPELNTHTDLNLDFRLAKGRGRYLCLSKLDQILSDDNEQSFLPFYGDDNAGFEEQDKTLFREMLQALTMGSWDGDRDNWRDEIDPRRWGKVTTDHRQCTGRRCSNVKNCAFFKARDSLESAECVVANHDLVLADLALGGGAILPAPEESVYVFDEGHHLPEKALNHFSHNVRLSASIRWLAQSEGQWPSIIAELSTLSYFSQLAQPLEALLKQTRLVLEQHSPLIHQLCANVDRRDFSPCLRFAEGQVPQELELLAAQLQTAFADLTECLANLYSELETLLEGQSSNVPRIDLENLYPLLGIWLARAENNLALWKSYTDTKPDKEWPMARWIRLYDNEGQTEHELVSSPILASRALQGSLWSRCHAAVVTSATITALNSFDRFRLHAGTGESASYFQVPSPFDYKNNAKLVIPKNSIDANDSLKHTESVIEILQSIVDTAAGTLVLFSSRKQMEEVYQSLSSPIKNVILMQGVESKQTLVRKHKARIDDSMGSILFGLASFAEGVDLPGNYCSHVVIAKIPFAVPDDPREAALSEWVDASGGNAFMQIAVPDASIKLIQACGRLLRTETDQGTISILDRRLLSKRYGRVILNSLPPFGGIDQL